MYGSDILCGGFWNFTQNIWPIHWMMCSLLRIEDLSVLGFTSSKCFWNAPLNHSTDERKYVKQTPEQHLQEPNFKSAFWKLISGTRSWHSSYSSLHIIYSLKYAHSFVLLCFVVVTFYGFIWFINNSSPPGQNGCHFTDNIFRSIFMNEKFCIAIQISLKFVRKGPIDNNPALV